MTTNNFSRGAAAIGLVVLGAATVLLWQRVTVPATVPATSMTMVGTKNAPSAASSDAAGAQTVTLTPELIARAGIATATAQTGAVTAQWHAPGSVEASAYRQVIVTPVAAGRVTAISAELGQRVIEGQTMAEIYSPMLAEAEREYLSARADLDLATQKRQRAEKLGSIGAVAQQEVEDARAEYARQTNAVESARARLRLLGLAPSAITALVSASDIDPVVKVPAPSNGLVIKRGANRGQNVDEKTELVTIADLSSVWVMAEVYERDMARIVVGAAARVTSMGLPGRVWTGRVTYLDPQVAADTRTLKARVEVPNADGALRPGMLADVSLNSAPGAATVVIPRTAVQQASGRAIVFVPQSGASGTYRVREVALGAANGASIEVRTGLSTGDIVVTDGAFALKAEWERTGGRLDAAPADAEARPAMAFAGPPQRVTLRVTEKGFEPQTIRVDAGRLVELVVTRTTDNTCGTEIVIGNGRQRAELPLNKPVTLTVGPLAKGELTISCGMAMLKGTVVAK